MADRDTVISKAMAIVAATMQTVYDAAQGYEPTDDITVDKALKTLKDTNFHFDEKPEADAFCSAYNMAIRGLESWWKVMMELLDMIVDLQDEGQLNDYQKGTIFGLRYAMNAVYGHLGDIRYEPPKEDSADADG